MTRGGGQRDWTKIATIALAVLSFLANIGWAAYGLSAKTRQDVEDRLRQVEITVARQGAQIEALRR